MARCPLCEDVAGKQDIPGDEQQLSFGIFLDCRKSGLIGLLFVSIAVRAGIGGASLWLFWTAEHSLTNVMEVLLWLPVRWGLGLLLPFVLGVMAWKTARIRSTQSATGILYVVVIFCFLGELLSQLLCRLTGYFL